MSGKVYWGLLAASHTPRLDLSGRYEGVYFVTFIKLNIYVARLLHFYNKKVLKQKTIPEFPARNTTVDGYLK